MSLQQNRRRCGADRAQSGYSCEKGETPVIERARLSLPKRALLSTQKKEMLLTWQSVVSIGGGLRLVAVDGIHGKCRKADSDVLGSAFMGSGITDPLVGVDDYGLSGDDFERASFMFYAECALKHDGELIEGRGLPGLDPSGGAAHMGYACR
jgi:hypothetical protein